MSPTTASNLAAPAVVKAPSVSAPAAENLGRTGLVLHGLAWVCALVAGLTAWLLKPLDDEVFTVQGVGGAAALALSFWAMVLGLRGYLRGESKRVTLACYALFWLEAAIIGLWQWGIALSWGATANALFTWGMWLALPVWGVYLGAGSLAAGLLAWLRVTMSARSRACQGLPPATMIERRCQGMRWYAGYLLLPGLLVMPASLYLFCAQVIGMAKGVTWQLHVPGWTPAGLKRAVNHLVSGYDGPCDRTIRTGLVLGGDLPADCLIDRLSDPNSMTRKYAWEVLAKEHQAAARKFALGAAMRSQEVFHDTQLRAGEFVGLQAPVAEIMLQLTDFDNLALYYREGLYRGLHRANRMQLMLMWELCERQRRAK